VGFFKTRKFISRIAEFETEEDLQTVMKRIPGTEYKGQLIHLEAEISVRCKRRFPDIRRPKSALALQVTDDLHHTHVDRLIGILDDVTLTVIHHEPLSLETTVDVRAAIEVLLRHEIREIRETTETAITVARVMKEVMVVEEVVACTEAERMTTRSFRLHETWTDNHFQGTTIVDLHATMIDDHRAMTIDDLHAMTIDGCRATMTVDHHATMTDGLRVMTIDVCRCLLETKSDDHRRPEMTIGEYHLEMTTAEGLHETIETEVEVDLMATRSVETASRIPWSSIRSKTFEHLAADKRFSILFTISLFQHALAAFPTSFQTSCANCSLP